MRRSPLSTNQTPPGNWKICFNYTANSKSLALSTIDQSDFILETKATANKTLGYCLPYLVSPIITILNKSAIPPPQYLTQAAP